MEQRRGVCFECHQDRLYGVIDEPAEPTPRDVGVLIVVGGPQYRVGSHRQFALLASELASNGYAAMRFDYRGMGDSEGEPRSFEHIDDDVRAAVDCFCLQCPQVTRVVLWGLCDAVPAALFYARQDDRIAGLILLNPWVRTEGGLARTYVKRYYAERLLQKDLWKKLFRGELDVGRSLREFCSAVAKALSGPRSASSAERSEPSLPDRMRLGLEQFSGPCLFILSGDDLTAGEFRDLVDSDSNWRRAMARDSVTVQQVREANHTFSRRAWRDRAARYTLEWLRSL